MSRSALAPSATIVSVRSMRRSETQLAVRSGGHRLEHLKHVYNERELVDLLTTYESARIQVAIEGSIAALLEARISLRVRRNFETYAAIRRTHGDIHLNQAFDPRETRFGHDDFWMLAENYKGEPIATYCLRRFLVEDFYALIRSQALWFSNRLHLVDPRFNVECAIPPFGGEVSHGGGLWVREDYRGCSRLAIIMPRFARATALRSRPFDHDSGMIRNHPQDGAKVADRKAAFMGKRIYGFARVHRFVDGWFPPEAREAIVYLCHSTRAEAIDSLVVPRGALDRLQCLNLRKMPLVYQHNEPLNTPTVRSKGQEQARV
jgi:hypothetical protein